MYLAHQALMGDTFQIELEFRSVGFWGEGKTRVPGEKPLGARTRTNNKLNPHMTPSSLKEICYVLSLVNKSFRGIVEGVCGMRPQVTFDVRSNSPFVSQASTRQFGRRI